MKGGKLYEPRSNNEFQKVLATDNPTEEKRYWIGLQKDKPGAEYGLSFLF